MIITCESCDAKNRVDQGSARNRRPVCGRCGKPLNLNEAGGSKPLTVTDKTFDPVVLKSGKPVLLDCWAPWCAPCRMIAPVVDQLAAEANGRYLVGKLNVDENPETAARFRIQSIPTLLIFKDGDVVDRIIGTESKQAIASRLAAVSK